MSKRNRKNNPNKKKTPVAVPDSLVPRAYEMGEALKKDKYLGKMFEFTASTGKVLVRFAFAEEGKSPSAVNMIFTNVMALASQFIDERQNDPSIACKAGCNFCCHMKVTASPIEILTLGLNLDAKLSPGDAKEIKERIKINADKTKALTAHEHANANIPCALLDRDGKCSMYEYRPMNCRRWLSFSKEACETAFKTSMGKGRVPIDGNAFIVGLGIGDGLEEGLKEARLDFESYELHTGLLRFLETSDAEAKWLRGEPVFQGCKQSTAST